MENQILRHCNDFDLPSLRLQCLILYRTNLVLLKNRVKKKKLKFFGKGANCGGSALSERLELTITQQELFEKKIEGTNMNEFNNQVVLITGGSRGIGAATARAFAANGAKISITFRSDRKSAEKCANEVRGIGVECLVIKASVEKEKSVKETIRKILKEFGRIDVLVNNAGIWRSGEIGKMTGKKWDETLEINLKGTFLFCNEVVRTVKRQKGGKIINISSTAGQRGEPFHSHYAASKGGVIAFTKSISVELAPFNINVNSVSPGWVDTDMTSEVLRDRSLRANIDKGIPRGRIAAPTDIVGAILFLASEASKHIVGTTINVNGGSVLF